MVELQIVSGCHAKEIEEFAAYVLDLYLGIHRVSPLLSNRYLVHYFIVIPKLLHVPVEFSASAVKLT